MIKIVFLFSIVFPIALNASVFQGPVSTSIGGAGSAGVLTLEASHLNPAALAHVNGYYMGFMYGAGTHQNYDGAPGSNVSGMGLVLTDASEEVAVPATLSYVKGNLFQDGQEFEETEIHVGVGYRLIELVSLGIAAKRVSRNIIRGPEKVEHNGSIGFLFTPGKTLGISLVFNDVLDSKDGFDLIPVTTVGAFWMYENAVRFYADWSQPQKSNPGRRDILALGIENILFGNYISVRTGGRWDQVLAKRFLAGGLGWEGPNLSVDYAYEKNVDSDEFRHLVDMRVLF
jgi:hypothetical protein